MENASIVFTLFLIFAGAALAATLALWMRQTLIIAYIVVGLLIGPSGLALIQDPTLIQNIANVGIIFLLFLLGLNLNPADLIRMAGETTLVTGLSSLALLGLGYGFGLFLGYGVTESLLLGSALMFSSTIIGLKLIPTTVLHHQHTGEIIISVLLFQDIIAIILLLVLESSTQAGSGDAWAVVRPVIGLPLLVLATWLVERFLLNRLIARFDRIQEYIFLLAIGWCLGVAEAAEWMGLSYEIGAFIAGVALARSPIALFIAENLKPLRDFFLIIFFVALGANFDLAVVQHIWLAALGLSLIALLAKPLLYHLLLRLSKESAGRSLEVAIRLGQMSEFSLLVAVLAAQMNVISDEVNYLIQFATLITFLVSSTYVVMTYPTPIAVSDRLRRD